MEDDYEDSDIYIGVVGFGVGTPGLIYICMYLFIIIIIFGGEGEAKRKTRFDINRFCVVVLFCF